jgi:hypothetical protein
VIGRARRILALVATRESRILFGNDGRQSIDRDHHEIRELGNDLHGAPLAGDGPRENLLLVHAGHLLS